MTPSAASAGPSQGPSITTSANTNINTTTTTIIIIMLLHITITTTTTAATMHIDRPRAANYVNKPKKAPNR